jgi:hypothetical protein
VRCTSRVVDDVPPESRLYGIGRSFLLGVLAVRFLVAGCSVSTPQPLCPGGCTSDAPANFKLSCSPNDLVSVVATGPCAIPDASVSHYTGTAAEWLALVSSRGPGTCHVVLTFATGFTYSQDVTFVVVPRDSCGCPSYISAQGGPFEVNNPPDTCVPLADAGAE